MATDELVAFGPILSRYRIASGLTQEELAERAGVSVRGISDLERGVNKSPRAHTVRQLAEALQLSADDRALFEGAARAAAAGRRMADAPPAGDFLGALPTGRLIGRDEEMRRLSTVLDEVSEGSGNLLFLSGEAGSGKTRLLQAVMVEARERGMVVLTGRCSASEQGSPYHPVLEALAQLASAWPEGVRGEGQRAWKHVQDVLGKTQGTDGAAQSGIIVQQLFGAVSDLLLLVAGSAPLVLLLDDLQWADPESLELHGEIGAGSMGRVFRAYDREREEEVAAKLVLARSEIALDTLLRFQQEGAVLARLDHPHIVQIHDTFVEEHASCIIMELLEGQSLGQILHDGPLPLARAKDLALQVADALAYAHSQQIVHRDIKPDNVMVLPQDQVTVTDFGIARILQPDTSLGTIATTGMRMGTPLYMAPEQIQGKAIDGRTDLYALGAMLYHMVTGRPPFEGSDALTVAVKHLQEEPVPPGRINPELPPEWDGLILKAMAKEPKQRFQSAGEMGQALQALPVQRESTAQPATGRPSRPRMSLAGGLGAVVVGLGALVTLIFGSLAAHGHAQSPLAVKLDTYLTSLAKQGHMSGTVLIARGGQVILSKGYGLADRAHHVPNGPTVKYPSIANFNINLTAALKLEEEGKLHGADSICRYLSSCPSSWKRVSVREVIDGSSGLPAINWADVPGTAAQSLVTCESVGLISVPAGTADYENCTTIVLGTIMERVTRRPWESVIKATVLGPAGMQDSGRLTDDLKPPARANDYNGRSAASGTRYYYNPYFELYASTPDILRYDEAFFGSTLLSPVILRSSLTPRDVSADPGITDARNALY